MAHSDFWTDHLIERLRDLWDEKLPTAEIGRRLGTSKNSIISKAHGIHLPGRPSPIRRERAPDWAVSNHQRKPRPIPLPAMSKEPLMSKEVPLAQPPRQPHEQQMTCRWLDGDEQKTWKFCDAPVKPKEGDKPQSAYCQEHHARCWHKPSSRTAR